MIDNFFIALAAIKAKLNKHGVKMFSFQGVHPPDSKSATEKLQIVPLPVNAGDEFFVVLTQHIGAPAKPVVVKGQAVKAGDIIAEAQGFVSANIHAPVSGEIVSIDETYYPVSGKAPCIVIKASGEEEYNSISDNENIAELAKSAGIVGMGGAMFPAHVKLAPREPLSILIVNGVECEPYLTCDHRLMLERGKDLIKACALVKESLNLSKAVIGIEGNKPDAVKYLKEISGGAVEIKELAVKYPQGGEKQLIQSVTGKEVPDGKLPSELGVIVHNVSTMLAIYDAKYNHLPLIRRVMTVTGDVAEPKNILVPIGTPLQRLIDFCGGAKGDIREVILGGPMMGFSAHSLSIPTYKGMNGIVISCSDKESFEDRLMPCIRCGKCVRACPIHLSPVMLENYYRAGMYDELLEWKVLSCIECGACNFACPSARPLKNLFRLGKAQARDIMLKAAKAKAGE